MCRRQQHHVELDLQSPASAMTKGVRKAHRISAHQHQHVRRIGKDALCVGICTGLRHQRDLFV